MELTVVFIVGLCAALTQAVHHQLDWSDCGSDASLTLRNIEATPMPMIVPGPLTLTIEADIGRALEDVDIVLDVKRHTFLLDLPIPCFHNLGSCTYHSSCHTGSIIDQMVTEDWAGITGNIGAQVRTMLTAAGVRGDVCPLPAINLNIQRFTINMPPIPSILQFFASGDYTVKTIVREKSTGATLMCLNLGLTLN